ncbi:MAG: hypothetical protein EPN92_04660 [Chitinophagaceae bacterium]|nr:MAG: hypothetical protein EPN92_04660 [Chitinophagaceae bacterium]
MDPYLSLASRPRHHLPTVIKTGAACTAASLRVTGWRIEKNFFQYLSPPILQLKTQPGYYQSSLNHIMQAFSPGIMIKSLRLFQPFSILHHSGNQTLRHLL